MKRRGRSPAAYLTMAVAAFAWSGCAPPAAPGAADLRPVATVLQLMESVIIPASDGVWSVSNEAPTTEEEWVAVERHAIALAESANLLLLPGRSFDEEIWRAQALALMSTAEAAAGAARARDLDRLLVVGDEILVTCSSCHREYMPRFRGPREGSPR